MTQRVIPDEAVTLYRVQREGRLAAWDVLVTQWTSDDADTAAARALVREQHDNGTRDHDAAFVARWGALPGGELEAGPVPAADNIPPIGPGASVERVGLEPKPPYFAEPDSIPDASGAA